LGRIELKVRNGKMTDGGKPNTWAEEHVNEFFLAQTPEVFP
jgi:hypothetical protein